jgi:hypothetical protein
MLYVVAMYSSPHRVVPILGKLPDLSTSVFDPYTKTCGDAVADARRGRQ